MGRNRSSKHITQAGLLGEIDAPSEGQRIVRAVGSRGGNIVEVEYPNGRTTLCLLPNKFNKTLWVKKGGYLLIEEAATAVSQPQISTTQSGDIAAAAQKLRLSESQQVDHACKQQQASASLPAQPQEALQPGSKVTGTILAILYDEQIKQLRKLPGVWPAEFTNSGQDSSGVAAAGKDDGLPPDESGSEAEGCEDDDDDDGLPPLEQNTNRRVIVHLVSDSEEEEGEED